MNDKIKINLQMAGASYSHNQPWGRGNGKRSRQAGRYQAQCVSGALSECVSGENYSMVAYQFALENLQLKDRNDTEPYTAKIKELTEVLETYFKEQ